MLDLIERDPAVASLDAAAYSVDRFKVTRPGLHNGIYRTLFFGFFNHATEQAKRRLEEDLVAMQGHVPEILNWAADPVVLGRGQRPIHYVWEQEFADEAGLTGPYMSTYHWGYVDRWFGPNASSTRPPFTIVQAPSPPAS